MSVKSIWKYNDELGIAFFCPNCKRFVCADGKCDCGADVIIDKAREAKQYRGKVRWDNYRVSRG